MARPSPILVGALRETAYRLSQGQQYSWGHHGQCNCGNLLQVITPLTSSEILRYAHTGIGEWTEMAEQYCSTSNAPVDWLIMQLEHVGLTPTDIHHIEYLTDREVLERLPGGFRWLQRNERDDVIQYFLAFANLLEEKWKSSVDQKLQEVLASREPAPVSVEQRS